jgi:hypothetical protein
LGIAAVMFVFGSLPSMAYAADTEADDLLGGFSSIGDIELMARGTNPGIAPSKCSEASLKAKCCKRRINSSTNIKLTCVGRDANGRRIEVKIQCNKTYRQKNCGSRASSSFTPATGGAAEITQD